jgi:hypothetical protein
MTGDRRPDGAKAPDGRRSRVAPSEPRRNAFEVGAGRVGAERHYAASSWRCGLAARWRGGRWLRTLIIFAAMVGALSPPALASGVRQLARSTIAFSSDGVRYAAWQVRAGGPIVVLDTRTGH